MYSCVMAGRTFAKLRSSNYDSAPGGLGVCAIGTIERFITARGNRRRTEMTASYPQWALGFHSAVVQLDQRSQQGQADPQAAFGSEPRLIALDEEIEDAGQHAGLNPAAVVGHSDHSPSILAPKLKPNVGPPRRVLRGIAQEVHLNLLEPRRIANDADRIVRKVDVHVDIPLGHERAEGFLWPRGAGSSFNPRGVDR